MTAENLPHIDKMTVLHRELYDLSTQLQAASHHFVPRLEELARILENVSTDEIDQQNAHLDLARTQYEFMLFMIEQRNKAIELIHCSGLSIESLVSQNEALIEAITSALAITKDIESWGIDAGKLQEKYEVTDLLDRYK